eukprot:gnl/MRDRNA2_/MRDRNA2_33869_c1_seq1.p1 gnl/MRDRNA2_/MRDRNA2_33869_c1~~gnl/MRDRNA2_/MRDRNA2_33869_c1_seq1.p1  ORF type:complete len:632 (+),score=89.89 gnl/MRDRNA2_/MRDRNA2_33869_c1_seq1:73-1968(+)
MGKQKELDESHEQLNDVDKEKAMRRAVYSEARKKTQNMKGARGSMFSKLASVIIESVSDLHQKQRIISIFSSNGNIFNNDEDDEEETEELSSGEWSDIAKSLLGSLDAIFMSMNVDPEVNKIIYNTLSAVIHNIQAADVQLAKLDKCAFQFESGYLGLRQQLAECEFYVRDLLGLIADDLDAMKAAIATHLRGKEAEAVLSVMNAIPLRPFKSRYQEVREKHDKSWQYIAPEHLRKENQAKDQNWCWKCWNHRCQCSRAMKESYRIEHEAGLHIKDTDPPTHTAPKETVLEDSCNEASHVSEALVADVDEPNNEGCNAIDGGQPQDIFRGKSLLGKIADIKARMAAWRKREPSQNNAHESGSVEREPSQNNAHASDTVEEPSIPEEPGNPVPVKRDTTQGLTPKIKGQDPAQRSANVSRSKERASYKGAPSPTASTAPSTVRTSKRMSQDRNAPVANGNGQRSMADDGPVEPAPTLASLAYPVDFLGPGLGSSSNYRSDDLDSDSEAFLEDVDQIKKSKVPGRGGKSNSYIVQGRDVASITMGPSLSLNTQFFCSLVPLRSPGTTWNRRFARRGRDLFPHLGDAMELERNSMSQSLPSNRSVPKSDKQISRERAIVLQIVRRNRDQGFIRI